MEISWFFRILLVIIVNARVELKKKKTVYGGLNPTYYFNIFNLGIGKELQS